MAKQAPKGRPHNRGAASRRNLGVRPVHPGRPADLRDQAAAQLVKGRGGRKRHSHADVLKKVG